ncbi:Iron-sulfur assembly protein IscU [Salmonella enterica subsp. enterica serovar Rubislaw str. A4-653]|uniref:Iron-sulfur assembly protein IscU n=1 Tax=Salmonella enterica subsp. enterica serovar Rubislaw str. A4-653 TaxID=913081 RepID=G5QMN6_SALRU|nr:Iron-sulfur assembly protein IscU [Salmonella enterica subsp. enterica serovar Rubislaw str. A4-653]
MAYSEKVIDHYENPRNVGSFDNNDDNVGSGMVGAPACGDVMKLQIKVNDEGIIEDARTRASRLTAAGKTRASRLTAAVPLSLPVLW